MGSILPEGSDFNSFGGVREPMAIVGLATRFPQEARNTEELWNFLLRGRCAHTPFPEDRIGRGHYHPDPEHGGSFAVKGGHFLSEDPAYFDAPFFNVTKGEVMAMDPQQRVVLESVYHALENAGLPIKAVSGSNTSVFVSGFNHDHLANLNTDPESTMKYKPTGTTNSLLSNRVSWFFDFKAPSVTLDTACSSSMVALHLSCQSLRSRECDLAVVSGVTMISFPTDIMSMGHHGFLSPEGRCFCFDHRADGYARGEGVGSLIVKRLSDAVRDGNTIRSVIRGIGVNQDGRTPGISMPSSLAQESLMKKVYTSAGLNVEDTMMVEAHGTGTAAGDPIEASAIARTFASRKNNIPLYVGAIKSGLGHLEGGAGVAGVIKGTLILENGIIPPNVNFEKVNPKIPLHKWNLQFPVKAVPWPSPGVRRISINSFGVGGTNAHVVLDDAYSFLSGLGIDAPHSTRETIPSQQEIDILVQNLSQEIGDNNSQTATILKMSTSNPDESRAQGTHSNGLPSSVAGIGISVQGKLNGLQSIEKEHPLPQLITISAFDELGVQRTANTLADHLQTKACLYSFDEQNLLDNFAHTISNRSVFAWKSFALASDVSELVISLRSLRKPIRARSMPSVGFVFTGQGAQWHAMGRELMCYPVYERSLADASSYMQAIGAPWSLWHEMLRSRSDSRLNEPYLAHAACAALQIALIDLLESWDIKPARVVGHSSGEIAAAYCAGKLSRESAWKVAYFRGFVSNRQVGAKGGMMAVGLSEREIQPFLEKVNNEATGELIIACFNSATNLTVSGELRKVDALKEILDEAKIFARKLHVENAYHSAHMKEVADEYRALLGSLHEKVNLSSEHIQMFSSVTGTRITNAHLGAEYWVENLVSPVRFADALSQLCFSQEQKGQASIQINVSTGSVFADILVEVGPHAALQSAIKETLALTPFAAAITSLGLLNRTMSGVETLLNAIGSLYARGYQIDVNKINQSSKQHLKSPGTKPRHLVCLPGYTFNHSEKLIYESRITKNYRLRKEPRHDLFGAPVPDWNAESPRWRNILRLNEQPWLRGHIVTHQVVMPGVGYLIAAIEASRQLADPDGIIMGFRLRDIVLKRALIVPENKEGVETMLSLTRMDESSLQASKIWHRFAVSSYNQLGNDWIEHCTGYITIDYETPPNPIDDGLEAREESLMWEQILQDVKEKCVVPVDIDELYDNLVTIGLEFGPLFKNLSNVRRTISHAGQMCGVVTVPDVAASMPMHSMHPHLIHPSTMDSFMHFFLSSVVDATGKKTLDRPMVPTFIKDVWVSAKLSPTVGHQFFGYGKSTLLAYDKYESDIKVWDVTNHEPRCSIEGVRATPLEAADSSSGLARKLNHEVKWVPYAEMLNTSALTDVSLATSQDDRDYSTWISKIQTATHLLIDDALKELRGNAPPGLGGHLLRYFEWLKQASHSLSIDEVSGVRLTDFKHYQNDPEMRSSLLREVEEYNADGALAVRMGRNIVNVLRGDEDPLHLMFGMDDILDRVYAQVAQLGDIPALQGAFLHIVADNSTDLRVLEVGAGTGSSTVAMLAGLVKKLEDGSFSSSVSTYTFTDISSAFFEKAKEKFRMYRDVMEYKLLDIEKEPDGELFGLGTYDIVVAQNVVHATADLKRSLRHIRSLLKPNGKLLLQEGVRQDFSWSTIAFGQLPGWWAGIEPSRRLSPWITTDQWNEIIRGSGYAGIQLELPDRSSPDLHTQSLFVACPSPEPYLHDHDIAIISETCGGEGGSELFISLMSTMQKEFKNIQISVVHVGDLTYRKLDNTVCISICEVERSLLSVLTKTEFVGIQKLLCTCKGLLWVTGDTTTNPDLGMITGLVRTVRWERDLDDANLLTLAIADPKPTGQLLAEKITHLYKQQYCGSLSTDQYQGEFRLENGTFLASRLVPANDADRYLGSQFSRAKPVMTQFKDSGRPIKLSTSAPGLLDKLEWVTDEVYSEPLASTHVEIDIKSVAMNFRDLMIAIGEHMAYSMGNEAAGVISRIGSDVKDLKIGDRVTYLCGIESTGCFHTFGRVDQNVVVKIPDDMSFEIACGLPCVYATVIYGLTDAGRLERGETILIHAAAGGVGQAAIHYAKYIGAEIFATVSTPEKRALVMELGVAEDHIFSSRDLSFVKGIMRKTNNKGVDMVLNSLSGEALRRSWDLLAPFGRFIEIGKKDAQNNGKVELRPFLRNVTMASVELPTMMRHRPHLIKRLTEDTVRLWTQGYIKEADPLKIMGYSQVEEGLRILQSGKGTGKMIFVPKPEDLLPIVPPRASPYRLNDNATYVLAGGLGGIGRSFARWMAKHGARNLVFLSSSANMTPAVVELTRDLEFEKCTAKIVRCDISDKDKLREVLADLKATLPPIRGVIQGAMKLKDTMFENMRYEEFELVVKPKVQGSWNLHELLPRDMDFFVMLSSATGILGNRAQANYAAGNTYQDALAHHRRSLLLPATTIDLGQVLSVGYVAENRDRAMVAKHLATVLEVVREDEIHILLQYLMDPRCSPPTQLVTGLTTAQMYRQRGMPTPTYLGFPLFTHLRNTTSSRHSGSEEDGGVLVEALLNAATTFEEAMTIVLEAVTTRLSSLLAVPAENIDRGKSVSSNGVDSLVAMEFRTFLAKELKADVPVLEIQGTVSIRDLCRKIAGISSAVLLAKEP